MIHSPVSVSRMLTIVLTMLALSPTCLHAELPPNFVIILCDDLGYGDIGPYKSAEVRTPHLDRLAREGMSFTDFHMASSVCSPSRAALLTGRYPQRTGVYFVIDPRTESTKRGIRSDVVTLAEALSDIGYATGCFGKWHLGHREEHLPTARGFDRFAGIPLSNDMPVPHELLFSEDARLNGYTRKQAYEAEPGVIPWMIQDRVTEFPVDQSQLTRRVTQASIDFIEEHADQPFFLYVPHPMPHVPLAVSDAFRGSSKAGLYTDVIQELDWAVGAILKKLDDLDLTERTLVIFTSDNGPWLRHGNRGGSSGPLRGGKTGPYEGGHRVPAIFRQTGVIPANTTQDELASAMDLMPTFIRMAGGQAPTGVDGRDITALLLDEKSASTPHDALFIEATVRRGDWKLILHPDGRMELFDLKNDPAETKNQSVDKPELVEELKALMPRDLLRPPRLPIRGQLSEKALRLYGIEP
ncbi:MAG: sulfatase [Phycisphaeraceae bacterium]